MGYLPFYKEEKKVQNKNLQNYSKIPTTYNIRLTHVGVEGVTCTVQFLADCLSGTQKWPVVCRSFGWLILLWTSMSLYGLWF